MPTLPFRSLPSARSHLPGRKVAVLSVTQARQDPGFPRLVIHLSCANTSQHQLSLSTADSHTSAVSGGKSSAASEPAFKRKACRCSYPLGKTTKMCRWESTSFPIRTISVNAESTGIDWATRNCRLSKPVTVNYQQFQMVQTNRVQTTVCTSLARP